MSQPFLRTIAQAYASHAKDLSDYLFVFPNRRASTFFVKNLTEEMGDRAAVLPAVTTMSDFVEKASGRIVAGRIELMFIMYQAYVDLQKKTGVQDIQEFDRFRRWGETALSDFNEVDMQGADADEIFKNVKDLREISSNFLTEDQMKVMEEFFGQAYDPNDVAKEFWKNFNDFKDNELHRRFLPIWQTMAPLYHTFHESLASKGLTSSGGAYRLAARNIADNISKYISSKKIVMVGFNALTQSEQSVFDALASYTTDDGNEPFVDFYWDSVGPVINDKTSAAGRYVLHNQERWPSPDWATPFLSQAAVGNLPENIKVISVPSNSLQTKIVGEILDDMAERLDSSDFEETKVAVVLPDESLLIPMLYSLPDNVGDVNLTMGYPLRLSNVSTFMTLLRRLLASRRKTGNTVGYYFRDFDAVLSHPFSHALFGKTVTDVKDWMKRHHHSIIDVSDVRDISPEMTRLLSPLSDDASPAEAVDWIDAILREVSARLTESSHGLMKANVDIANVDFFRISLRQLLEIVKEYGISMQWRTFLSISDRMISAETVNFEGQPLRGLQVMGMLETRALDFERIIIPSLNERILPAKGRTRTFISDSLRKAYGLPPVNYSESIFAYYFFRMIARAKEVVLLYDSRSSEGVRSGDVSRYVLQLQYLYGKDKMKIESRSFDISKSDLHPSSIEKTPEIMDILSSFRDAGPKGRNLSATSLNQYVDCQVRFYFERLLRLRTDEEAVDYIDAITQGKIVHFVMENIYLPKEKQGHYLSSPELIDSDLIRSFINNLKGIDRLIRIAINKEHFHRPDDKLDTPLRGSVAYVAKVLRTQILGILNFDLKQTPFLLYGTEIEGDVALEMPEGAPVNMRFAIDRLDKVRISDSAGDRDIMRVVDYKTGSVHVEAESMQGVFEGDLKGRNLLQLWLYANLFDALDNKNIAKEAPRPLLKLFGEDSCLPHIPMLLELYDVSHMNKGAHVYPKIEGAEIKDHSEYNDEFLQSLESTLTQLFDESQPFLPASDPASCNYCPFKTICWR